MKLFESFKSQGNFPIDSRHVQPTLATAKINIPESQRYLGLTVFIEELKKEYIWQNFITDNGLIEKITDNGSTVDVEGYTRRIITTNTTAINKEYLLVVFEEDVTNIQIYGDTALIINSEDNTEGKWKAYNNYYVGETTNVYRTDGAPSAIRLKSNSNVRVPLNIGYEDFKNLEVTADAPGNYNLIIKFMHSNLATASVTSLQDYLIAFITYYKNFNSKFVKKELSSHTAGHWETDSVSIWNNEEYVKPLQCVIPLKIEGITDELRTVSVRLEYDLYDANGRVYFDPAIELVPATEPTLKTITDFEYNYTTDFKTDIWSVITTNANISYSTTTDMITDLNDQLNDNPISITDFRTISYVNGSINYYTSPITAQVTYNYLDILDFIKDKFETLSIDTTAIEFFLDEYSSVFTGTTDLTLTYNLK
jgi:hypothetical protein